MKVIYTLIVLMFSVIGLFGQTAKVSGVVKDKETKSAVDFVTVFVKDKNIVVETDSRGRYSIEVPALEKFVLSFTRVGYVQKDVPFNALSAGAKRKLNIDFVSIESDIEIIVTERKIEDGGLVRESVEGLKLLPTTTGNIESVLPSIALGISQGSGGELSSQYNVRGGNYDENLVYVNDFEIYRPQLIRAGQQEGLTFANMDLVRELKFSSGGFDAKYGDKLSSVLDIHYKLPDSLRASIGMSALGGSTHLEGSIKVGKKEYQRFRYLLGARYKTTRYLLSSLDIKGEYLPDFYDVQGYFTYDITRDWQIGAIGNFNRSVFQFIPEERSTGFGLINFALQLFSQFEGREVDDFTVGMGGLSLTYLPDRSSNPYYLKFLASSFQIDENERFDIIGDYRLREVDSGLGSDNFGNVVREIAEGTQHQYIRNFLYSNVSNFEHKGGVEFEMDTKDLDKTATHFLQWGAKFQHEYIFDKINEWERLDSAGYSLPYDTAQVLINEVYKSKNELQSNRFSTFIQDTYTWRKDSVSEWKLSTGVRASYWDFNKEFIVSPRAQFLYKPLNRKRDISYRVAAGLYHQPPFYRELRALDGTVSDSVKAQKSFHFVSGLTWDFYAGKRNPKKMRFIVEAYYKSLWDQVSYDIENVRIRYSGRNDSKGYIMGVDLRLNGEFVPGAESWINLSLLRARESIDGIQHQAREVGDTIGQLVNYVPRPTDQLMTLSMYFQDYLPKNENFKTHVNLTIGTGLPYGVKGNNLEFRNPYRFSPYHRIDIGFSYALWDASKKSKRPRHPLRFTRSTWLSLEVFNLLKVQNQASNTWIKTIFEQQFAIPNYLTSRRINLRLRMEF